MRFLRVCGFWLFLLFPNLCCAHFHRLRRNEHHFRDSADLIASMYSGKQATTFGKIRLYFYGGYLRRVVSPILLFSSSHYSYCLSDEHGKTIAFLDISDLATSTPLINYLGKRVSVRGISFPHKYRGVMVIKVQHMAIPAYF